MSHIKCIIFAIVISISSVTSAISQALISFSEASVNALVNSAKDTGIAAVTGDDLGTAAGMAALNSFAEAVAESYVNKAIERGIITLSSREEIIKWFSTRLTEKSKSLIETVSRENLKLIGGDLIASIVVDLAADYFREIAGGEGSLAGESVYFTTKQLGVAFALTQGGPAGGVIAAGWVSGAQVLRAGQLAAELSEINSDTRITDAIYNAHLTARSLSDSYVKSQPGTERSIARENLVRHYEENMIYRPRFRFSDDLVPGGYGIIQGVLSSLDARRDNRDYVVRKFIDEINISTDTRKVDALVSLAQEFIDNNYPQRGQVPAIDTVRKFGEVRDASFAAKNRIRYGDDYIEMSLDEVFDFIINESSNIADSDIAASAFDNNDRGTSTVLMPSRGDREEVTFNRIIEVARPIAVMPQPTGPTPEEIAEAERQAELQRQAAITALEDERDRHFLVKLDAEARIRNNNNRLAILEFDERERVQNVLSVVNAEAARLRGELNSTGLSDADAKRLQDIMRYGEVLEAELERIATEETSLRTRNTEYQQALDAANATIVRNSNQLNALNYDWNEYTVPTISVVLPDWSNYEYELPPFDQTDVPTTELRNAVVSSVSLPVTTSTIRNSGTLISEDGEDTRFDAFGVSESQSEKLDDFNHLFLGRNSTGLQWIYGEASTPEQFGLRTGTATFRGGLSGYYAHGTLSSNTVYRDSVAGNLLLNVNFGTNMLSGEGTLGIDNVARREEISFQISPASITENNDGLSRSLRFASNATLLNGIAGNGNFSGAFYGLDASEAAGSFAFNLDGGFAAGLWATGENYVPRDDEGGFSGAYVIGYSAREDGYGTAWDEGEQVSATRLNYFNGDGDGSVDIVSTLPSGSFSFVSWGAWVENSTTRNALGNAGYWLHVDPVTSPAIVENRTGTAQYGGEIIGGYVSSGNIRQDSQGIISLTSNFADQSIGGQFQFGRNCSGSGLSGCSVASEVQSFNEPINAYDGAGFGNFERIGSSGVVGVFAGDNAQEIGGHAWLTENQGMYIGVFRAREGLSFGSFVTPISEQSSSIDYANYRGLLAYRGFEDEPDLFAEVGEPVSGFVGVQSVSDTGEVAFNNSNLTLSAAHSSTDSHGTYSYATWGEWDSRSAGSVFTIDVQLVAEGRGNWLVYDPTTDLPTSGSASYQGSVDGAGSGIAGGIVRGGINLEADFGSDRITGSMSLRDGNNNSWADAAFDAPITRSTDSSGFQGGLTGANVDSGIIFGGFAGPNAEEVGGGWQIDHINGSDANGIFRAQQ